MSELVCVKVFDNVGSAETAVELLKSHGIEALIESGESGGMTPAVAGADTRVMVQADEAGRAKELLGP